MKINKAIELNNSPYGCELLAREALNNGRPDLAIAWLNVAYARARGHKRRDTYEKRANVMAKEYGVPRHHKYPSEMLTIQFK